MLTSPGIIFHSHNSGCSRAGPARRWLKRWTALAAVTLAATGCAVAPPAFDYRPALTAKSTVAAEEGIVVARIVNASGSPLPFNHLTLAPKNLNASEDIKPLQLNHVNALAGDSSLFVSSVPAGEYSISTVVSYYSTGTFWYFRGAEAGVDMGTFSVAAGDIVDLGTLIFYPKSQGDNYLNTIIRSPASSNAELVSAFTPFVDYQPDLVTSWDDDGRDDERYSVYASTVQNPVVYNTRYRAPDNSVYFIGKLGYILQRTADGDWQEDALDTDADLYAIAVNDRGDKIVGGEQGLLFYKRSNAREWQSIDIDPTLNVQKLAFNSTGGVDVMAWNRQRLNVFRIASLATPAEQQTLISFKPDSGWRDGNDELLSQVTQPNTSSTSTGMIAYLYTESMGNKEYLFLGDKLAAGDGSFSLLTPLRNRYAFQYQLDPAKLTAIEDFGEGVDRILDAGYLKLGIKEAGFWSWTGKDTYLRYDADEKDWIPMVTKVDYCPGTERNVSRCKVNGKVHRRYRSFNFMGLPVFSSELDATAFVNLAVAGQDPELAIINTSDGGKTWLEVSHEMPGKYCSNSIPEVEGTLLVACWGMSSDFYQSDDGGKSWQHVRQSENF